MQYQELAKLFVDLSKLLRKPVMLFLKRARLLMELL
jgi:hypothetical protein